MLGKLLRWAATLRAASQWSAAFWTTTFWASSLGAATLRKAAGSTRATASATSETCDHGRVLFQGDSAVTVGVGCLKAFTLHSVAGFVLSDLAVLVGILLFEASLGVAAAAGAASHLPWWTTCTG